MKKSLFAIACAAALVMACKPEEVPVTPALTLTSEAEVAVPIEGGIFTVEFDTNTPWKAALDVAADVAELNVTSGTAEDKKVKVTISENKEENTDRTITLTITGEEVEPVKVVFNQASKFVPYFTISEEEASVGPDGKIIEIEVTTNVADWAVEVPEDANSWLHIEKSDSKVSVTVDPLTTLDDEREAELTFTAGELEPIVFPVYQEGPASVLWYINPSVALEGFDPQVKSSLANIGDNLLVSNGTKVYVLNAMTGEVVNKIDFPEGFACDRLVSDDAGHLLASVDVGYDWTEGVEQKNLIIYKVDIENMSVEPFLSYNLGNLWCSDTGNIRVAGDITKHAEIVATVAGSGYCIVWHVEDGVPTTWYWANTPYVGSSVANSCAAPAGPSIEDGLYFIGYGGDYNLHYLDTFVPDSDQNVWGTAYVTGSSWMENYNCIDVAEYKGTKYVGIVAGCHFNYDATDVYVLDASNKASIENVVMHIDCDSYVSRDDAWANLNWTGGGTYSDIILVPTDSALMIGYIDTNFNVLGVSRWFE